MKKKTFNHLMAGLVLSCVVLGLTACKSGGSLTGSLAKRTINTISSVLKDNKDEKSADDETGAEGAEEEETGETGKDISGESTDKEDGTGENANSQNAVSESHAKEKAAQESLINTAQAEEISRELEIYLEKPPLYSDVYWTKPVIITEYDAIHANKENYPKLAQALEAYNAESAAVAAAWENENRAAAAAEREEYGENYPPYTFQRDFSVMRADQYGVGILCEDYWKFGGMTSSVEYTIRGKNIDPLTGKDLALEDVIADIPQLIRALIDEYYIQRPEESTYMGYLENAEEIIASQFEKNQPEENQPVWVLGCQGITFCYNPGILTGGRGYVEITLLYEKYPELFKAPFKKEPEEFALYDEGGRWNADIDKDGVLEEIYILDAPAEIMSNEIRFFLDGEECFIQKEEYNFLGDKYLLKNKDGNYYIYLVTSEVDEVGRVLVFTLTENGVKYQGDVFGWITGSLVTKPSHFNLGNRIGVLSNRIAYQHYHMGNDGMPKADEEIYYFPGWDEDIDEDLWTWAITTKKPLPAWKILEDGSISSTTENIPAGVKCLPVRSDEKTFVDIQAQDGRRWRIDYHINEDWTRTIWGEDENEYFFDIVYAG